NTILPSRKGIFMHPPQEEFLPKVGFGNKRAGGHCFASRKSSFLQKQKSCASTHNIATCCRNSAFRKRCPVRSVTLIAFSLSILFLPAFITAQQNSSASPATAASGQFPRRYSHTSHPEGNAFVEEVESGRSGKASGRH